MKTVLFVCTGNTCRSPMAACLFNAFQKLAADRLGPMPPQAQSAPLHGAQCALGCGIAGESLHPG